MHTKRFFKVLALLAIVAVIGLAVFTILAPDVFASNGNQNIRKLREIEVAEDGTRFVSDEAPVFDEDGFPAYGAAFVTQGYIYPAGTITCVNNDCNGVNPDGSPEFPDLVMGEWTCWGYHVGDGAHTLTGPIVVTNQLFSFGEEFGDVMLTTTGYELADFDTSFRRAITGGTGPFAKARGEMVQTVLGFDGDPFGVSLGFELDVK